MLLFTRIAAGAAAALALGGIASADVPDPIVPSKPLNVLVHHDAKRDRYCITDPSSLPTGSIMPRSACKTQEQWAKEGVQITHR